MGISNMTLVKIASIGGVVTVSMGLAYRSKINNNIKNTDYYKDALKTLRSHKASIHLLGEPIKEGTIDISNEENNFTKTYSAKYEVPVRGPKDRGILYFWASKSTDEKWTVHRMELGLKNEPDKRLLVKNLEDKT